MKAKILLADDDEDLVEVLADRLEAEGYKTLRAHEGLQAVEVAQSEKPDLIILDWKMPTGKGSAVLEMLAEKQVTQKIPVIILSGIDEPGMKETARYLGAREILRKPCETPALLKLIKSILGSASPSKK